MVIFRKGQDTSTARERPKRNPAKDQSDISTFAKKTSMIEEVKSMLGSITEPTFDDYTGVLKKLYVIDDINGWYPSIRSASGMRSDPKREFECT